MFDCDNNQPINGETNQSFTATNSGNYAVEVTLNGCVSVSSCYNLDLSSVNSGIWEGLSIHPNPVVDEFSIELPNLNQKLDVSIFDSQSKLIEKFNINSIN